MGGHRAVTKPRAKRREFSSDRFISRRSFAGPGGGAGVFESFWCYTLGWAIFSVAHLRMKKASELRGGAVVSVVLADDHVVVRQGVRALLESDPKFKVVGEAMDGLEAVELVKRRKPSVLIADLMMPGQDGLATTREVSRLKSDTRVIILSMYGDQAYVLEALKSGAAGYVVKESCGAELFQALRVVVAGGRYLSPAVSEASIGSFSSMGTILQKAQAGSMEVHDKLTARERTVLQLVVEGASSRDIGARLRISSRKVESHRTNLMRKLRLKTRQDLIRYALQRGVIPTAKPKSLRKKAQQ
jgi:two-component system response regulator NreC